MENMFYKTSTLTIQIFFFIICEMFILLHNFCERMKKKYEKLCWTSSRVRFLFKREERKQNQKKVVWVCEIIFGSCLSFHTAKGWKVLGSNILQSFVIWRTEKFNVSDLIFKVVGTVIGWWIAPYFQHNFLDWIFLRIIFCA